MNRKTPSKFSEPSFCSSSFYAGRRFDYLKSAIFSHTPAPQLENVPDKFPGVSAEELIETGLAAQRRDDWPDAAEHFLAAKRKNLTIPGVLFLVGKGHFNRGDLDHADDAFTQAIRFGENLPEANYYRGLIAMRRHDFPAAARFFEAATNAEPFAAHYYLYWGDTLRLDHHPTEAIHRYQQALQRTPGEQDAGALCEFKIRLARLEAGAASQVRGELVGKHQAGPLPVGWMMTEAALQIYAGENQNAVQLISEARAAGPTGLFVNCASDSLFRAAGEKQSDIAKALATVPAPNE